jgi:bifunctional DNA-binding transcriptional regulator/antitoxin component of YhaV-PrlF toxin-antitoxin module
MSKMNVAPMKKYKFKATIQAGDGGGAFVFFPFDVEKEFRTKGKVPVKVTFDGVEDTGSLFRYGYPQHLVGVPKAIRDQLGKKPGDSLEVALWKDEEPRTILVPPEFKKLLEEENLTESFEKLSYTHRKEYCRWINEARREETKRTRLAKAIDMIRKGVKTRPGP